MIKKKQQRKPPRKLIDRIEEAFKEADYQVKRSGWTENMHGDPPNDKCEWLDLYLYDEAGDRFTVHLYFTNNAKRLDDVNIILEKKTFEEFGIIKNKK